MEQTKNVKCIRSTRSIWAAHMLLVLHTSLYNIISLSVLLLHMYVYCLIRKQYMMYLGNCISQSLIPCTCPVNAQQTPKDCERGRKRLSLRYVYVIRITLHNITCAHIIHMHYYILL